MQRPLGKATFKCKVVGSRSPGIGQRRNDPRSKEIIKRENDVPEAMEKIASLQKLGAVYV